MLYFMSFAKEAIAHLTRRKSSLHLASQVVGRMGKPAQNYQAPLTGKHVRCDSICGFSSTAMNLFQISAGSLDSKGSYFLPCFTIWWWTKWLLSHRLQPMCPSNYIPLCRSYIAEKQMSLLLFIWRCHTSSVSMIIWSNPLPDILTISNLGKTSRFHIILFFFFSPLWGFCHVVPCESHPQPMRLFW